MKKKDILETIKEVLNCISETINYATQEEESMECVDTVKLVDDIENIEYKLLSIIGKKKKKKGVREVKKEFCMDCGCELDESEIRSGHNRCDSCQEDYWNEMRDEDE
jgi:predicted Zn-ribbon and HTH transcriptional regulator